jgi:hypothetical protein
MPFFKLTKTMQYTETVYIEANDSIQAQDNSGAEEGDMNHDDIWVDSRAKEITEDEFQEATC